MLQAVMIKTWVKKVHKTVVSSTHLFQLLMHLAHRPSETHRLTFLLKSGLTQIAEKSNKLRAKKLRRVTTITNQLVQTKVKKKRNYQMTSVNNSV